MQRQIYNRLLQWKQSAEHKPLILLGARQVGKTYILQELGRREFADTLYLNCHEEPQAQWIFRDLDVDRIIHDLESLFGKRIVAGETLVVVDEVQEVRGGVASLKYFCEKHRDLHVAVAGSLLGISLQEGESYPVGKVQTMHLYPMTFTEYLAARGQDNMVQCLRRLDWGTMPLFHDKLLSLLREYYFVGGMPEAVQQYIATADTAAVRAIQAEILDAYMRDMAKHTATLSQRIRQVWDSVPSQLARENKKFVFGAVRKGARAADFELAIQWLINAGLAYSVKRVKTPALPLKFYADSAAFKLYMLDCGLLACLTNTPPAEILTGMTAYVEFKGAFTENYVLQQLRAVLDTPEIFYFAKENSTQEVDFVVQAEQRLVPIEVKAGVNTKSKSLAGFVKVDHAALQLKGVRCSLQPYDDQGWMENIPLYAIEPYIQANNQSTDNPL